MQIALFVLPLVVVLGWTIGEDNLTPLFDGFQMTVLFVAILVVSHLERDGNSHWPEGML